MIKNGRENSIRSWPIKETSNFSRNLHPKAKFLSVPDVTRKVTDTRVAFVVIVNSQQDCSLSDAMYERKVPSIGV